MGAGRPEFKPTDEQRKDVERYASVGVTQEFIATMIGIDAKTLRKHFLHEFKAGKAKMITMVAQRLVKGAIEQDCYKRQMFILKTQGGEAWRETQHILQENSLKFISSEVLNEDEFERKYNTEGNDSLESTAEAEDFD